MPPKGKQLMKTAAEPKSGAIKKQHHLQVGSVAGTEEVKKVYKNQMLAYTLIKRTQKWSKSEKITYFRKFEEWYIKYKNEVDSTQACIEYHRTK